VRVTKVTQLPKAIDGHKDVQYKFDRVAMDILDFTSISNCGIRCMLIIADYFTKYTEAFAISNIQIRL
jgi:hypothetical protein